jgi:hypothetical protein
MNIWPKTNWTDAGQIFAFIGGAIRHDGPDEALTQPPPVYFQKLVGDGKLYEAIYFISHALPRYESVVWAAQSLLASGSVDRNNPLVVAVLRWIDDPCEELRRKIEELIAEQTIITPEYMLANSAFMSGGSITIPESPPVLAPPDACAKFAAGAVFNAADESENSAQVLRQAADLGNAIASQAG